MKRRNFLGTAAVSLAIPEVLKNLLKGGKHGNPTVIATWKNTKAVEAAWKIIEAGGRSLDAVEAGARIPEEDPGDISVGYGGYPDRDGHVSLDACIMDEKGNAGSVVFLEDIMHPVSVARMVMEKTPHVILAGSGALQFALENGFKRENILTDHAKKAWEEWKIKSEYKPVINIESHDTIGILALDKTGNLSGACTTSGLAFKIRGRVGDSPIIGAGLYVDNEVGAATATGLGESVIKKVGAFSIVEMMRHGMSPNKACKEAASRLLSIKTKDPYQVGYLAINKKGEIGAWSLRQGFSVSILDSNGFRLIKSSSILSE
jgi:N4-(beta-N-acetylglucosaminyl)-L-asparaginase